VGRLIAISLVALLALGEGALRFAHARGLAGLDDPKHFASPYCGDDFARMQLLREHPASASPDASVAHESLGWIPAPDSAHYPDESAIPAESSERPWIALFGSAPVADLRARLAPRIAPVPVVDFQVPGHGLDQIYLRFEEVLGRTPAPRTAVVALRTDDLDSVIQTLSAAPKPHFVVGSEGLELRGLPIPGSFEAWEQRRGTALRSLLFSLARTYLSEALDDERGFYTECRRAEKEVLARALLAALRASADARGIELVFALHESPAAGQRPSWRSGFLQSELDTLGVDALDVRRMLREEGGQSSGVDLLAERLEQRLAQVSDYAWGTRIDLGLGGNADPYLGEGWARLRGNYRWTAAPSATLRISPPAAPGGILAEIVFLDAVASADDTRDVVVRAGGVAIGRIPIHKLILKRWKEVLHLDAGLAATRPLQLSFEVEPLLTPEQVGRSADRRQLGVAVAALTLRRAEPLPSATAAR
jgi:hypothetical protein